MTAYVVAEGFRSEPIYESLQKGLLSSSSDAFGHEAAFYHNLFAECHKRHVEPFVTLHHFDTPILVSW